MTRDVLTRPAREPDRTVATGPGPTQRYDVWLGADAAVTVFLVHGGFWREEWDRTHLRPLAAHLAERGHTVVLPEFRRTGMPGGTWPGPGEDVAQALAAVRADEELPDPVLLVGHSAGGHLAVWLLHRPEAAGVLGAVSLAGCLDLRMVGRLGLDDGAADALMGGAAGWVDAPFLGADPVDLGPTPAPVQVLHGHDDTLVPAAVSRSWFGHCGTPHRDRLVLLDRCEHFDLIDPDSVAFPAVTQAIGALTGGHR